MVGKYHVRSARSFSLALLTLLIGQLPVFVGAQDPTAPPKHVAANANEATTENTQRVTISVSNAPLATVLTSIAQQAGLVAAYDGTIIPRHTLVTLHVTKIPVADAFEQALRGTGFVALVRGTGEVFILRDRGGIRMAGIISGHVTVAGTKNPVVSAVVSIEGTKLAARTDEHGAFRIVGVPAGSYTVIVRRLGYTAERRPATVTDEGVTTLDVALRVSATQLEQVVTTVTGAQRRLEIGNVIGVIKADSLVKEAPITSISQLLTARVPGLSVTQGQGTVGGDVRLQVRGQSSINLSSEPIVIVDGIRYSSSAGAPVGGRAERVSPLNDLNPNDIETVEVVKGPSAATLYGTDASNGVIVITTKRGKAGPPRWAAFIKGMTDEIPDNGGFTDRYRSWPAGCDLFTQASGYCTQDSVAAVPNALGNSEMSVLRPAKSMGYGTSVSGGQPALRYFFSGNFDDLTGSVGLPSVLVKALKASRGVSKLPDELLRPNTQTLLNLRSNVTASVGSKLDLTVSGGYVHGVTHSMTASDNYSPFARAYFEDPTSDRYLNSAFSQFSQTLLENNDRFISGINGQARPASWLTARATVGLDVAMRSNEDIFPRDTTRQDTPNGSIRETRNRQVNTSADGGATATIQRGRVSFRTSAGGQYVRTLSDMIRAQGTNLPPGVTSIDRAASTSSTQSHQETVTLGTYIEETIGLNERIFLTGAARSDGGSAFGKGYNAAVYPKMSMSWLLSQEPLVPKIRGLDELRIRAALGASGHQAQPTWALPSYDIASNLPEEAGYGHPVMLGSLGNRGLRPERGREIETGIDVGMFAQRLQGEFTWYGRRTTDQIATQALPDGLGFRYTNLGLTTEHGFEASISATLIDAKLLHWQVSLQHSYDATKLVNIGSGTQLKQPEGGYVEGYPLGARFILPLLGYSDTNDNGIIEPDEVQLGDSPTYAGPNTQPRHQTFSTTFGLFQQRLRLSALFERQSGGTVINKFCEGGCRANYDRTAPFADQARAMALWVFVPGYRSYEYAESANFTRLNEVSAVATLPARVLRMFRMTSGSIALSARNLGLWTRFSGADPSSIPNYMSVGQSPTEQYAPTGIPQSRTWALRLDLGL